MIKFKLFIHKLIHWEYWPYQVVYLPVYFQYLYYAFRTRSFFYFNASNPTIKNGGFFMESKKEIYDLIPQEYYPKTILVTPNEDFEAIVQKINDTRIEFPFIAKPDIGLRGTAVKKIHDIEELKRYLEKAKFDILIQDLIPYENEIGLFYVKLPNEDGKITGIVSKEFMIIKGNGKNTIRELLHKDKRYLFQLETLELEYKEKLNEVLKLGETINLVPYGNHCRGTKFVDASHEITPEMIASFNTICDKIDGFYFGRMDIMYNSFSDLAKGKNLQIVEINGAISEPTHMYDPKHSLLFGWKELTRHFHYMYLISKENKKNGAKYLTFNEGVTEFKNHHKHYDKILEF
ncbi:D-alanine--D-alanine ligase [Flavobacterium channae]|uniref:D-alanine--D-alanine ligase n=1 Tax=Flavobacterium channae TaxID=2897181 RepID=UPI001E302150|nr:D-alanine--D-alanine ligase [Flavobacterium channae]UGS22873.1 D-alanine--D-alanine ligase [Flavobacterium channae]